MKIKEIHDNLLSLFLRGLGIWILYLSLDILTTTADDACRFFQHDPNLSGGWWWDFYFWALKVLMAAYFILGAPPFLKWATRGKDNSN